LNPLCPFLKNKETGLLRTISEQKMKPSLKSVHGTRVWMLRLCRLLLFCSVIVQKKPVYRLFLKGHNQGSEREGG